MKKGIKKRYEEVVTEIMKRAPKELSGENLFVTKHVYADTKKLLELSLGEESISSEKKEKFKNILDSGTLDEEQYYVKEINMEVAKKKEQWVEQELLKYVERGELPKYVGRNITRSIKQRIKNERNSTENN